MCGNHRSPAWPLDGEWLLMCLYQEARKWQHCNITLGDMYLTGYLLPRYVYAAWSSFSEIY